MFGVKIDQFKSGFFDRTAVIAAEDRATRKVLSKFGAFVRTRARSSLRKRKRTSAGGQPPSSHTGELKQIFFSYDGERRSVVIGPVRLNSKHGDAPAALEYGGESRVLVGRRGARRLVRIVIQARPFMGPAFAAELPQLPPLWRDSIK